MDSIPDWVWKVISICVLPLAAWVWSTQGALTVQQLQIEHLAEKLDEQHKRVEEISDLKSDIKVLESKMDTVLDELGDVKKMMIAK